MVERIVVVGGGLAGFRAVGALRRRGFTGALTLIGDETHRPYDRPPLTKELLAGLIEPERCFYSCDGLDVDWILGARATSLSVDSRLVRLDCGAAIAFDALVIATGRRARRWPFPLHLEGIRTLRSLDDALTLREAAHPGCRAAIVGAGFIGCEVAATLRQRGLEEVTLIDLAAHPMPSLGPEIGKRVARLHAEHGIRLRMNSSVAAFEGDARVASLRLASGERIDADLVVLALGSLPNTEWLRDSGLELFRGTLRCDNHGVAVGTDNIVAVGDVAAFPHPVGGGLVSIEHWSNARDMATTVAPNLLLAPTERKPYVTVPSFWSDQYESKIKSTGFIERANRFTVIDDDPGTWAALVEAHRDDKLVGAVAVNRNKAIGDYQRQLAESDWHMITASAPIPRSGSAR